MIALHQHQLFDEIDMLPIDLKTKIVDKILSSINPKNESIDDLLIEEVNKRKIEIETNNTTLVNGEDVFKKLHKDLIV